MEQRKVIQFGKTALGMTLPHTWLKNHRVNKGDVVNVQLTPRLSLEVFPKSVPSERSSTLAINITGKSTDEIVQLILSTYLNGYTIVKLEGDNKGKVAYLREHIHEFIAAEIMEVTSNKIVIHVFWDVDTVDLKSILRRIDHIIRSMFEETNDLVGPVTRTNDILQKGYEVNRQVLLGRRAITYALNNAETAQRFNLSGLDLHYLSFVLYFSGKIAEQIVHAAESIQQAIQDDDMPKAGRDDLSTLLERTTTYYVKVLDVFNKKNEGQRYINSEYQDFNEAIKIFRQKNHHLWRPTAAEYLTMLARTIKEMEFVMINLENSPKKVRMAAV
jgi:phosphate uptake regulator